MPNSIRRKLFKSGEVGKEYMTIRIPRMLADKYNLNSPCYVELIDLEKQGILIKKLSG